jgi:hypothetical protein
MKLDPFDPDWMGLKENKADHKNTISICPLLLPPSDRM